MGGVRGVGCGRESYRTIHLNLFYFLIFFLINGYYKKVFAGLYTFTSIQVCACMCKKLSTQHKHTHIHRHTTFVSVCFVSIFFLKKIRLKSGTNLRKSICVIRK